MAPSADPALRFAPLDHPEFRQLSFREQVHAVGLYTFHQDEYGDACRERGFQVDPSKLPTAVRRVTEAMTLLDKLRSEPLPEPDPSFAFQVIRQWAGYRCAYHRQWGPVDREMFRATSHWVVNVRLFHLPVLALSPRAFYLWDRLSVLRPNTPSAHMVILAALMLSQADQEGVPDVHLAAGKVRKRDLRGRFKQVQAAREKVWQTLYPAALAKLPGIHTLDDLQKASRSLQDDADGSLASVVSPNPSHVRLGPAMKAHRLPRNCDLHPFSLVSRRLLVLGQPRCSSRHVHLPLLPEFFYVRDGTFTVKDWDLLR